MNIREYLDTIAGRITSDALGGIDSAAAWRRGLPERRTAFLAMMGLPGFDPGGRRDAPPVVSTGQFGRES